MNSFDCKQSKQKSQKNSFVTVSLLQDKLKKVPGFKPAPCNPGIRKEDGKVVNTIDIEDMGDKGVFCRCWKSKKFPYCDGSHNKHNEECGDNVGPLIITAKKSQ